MVRLPEVSNAASTPGSANDGALPVSTARAKKSIPVKADGKLLKPQAASYWHEIGIFPEAIEQLGRLDGLLDDARTTLSSLGLGSLRLLCEQARIAMPEESVDRDLANHLLSECDPWTLVHLREFLRRRSDAIDTIYSQRFKSRDRSGFEAAVRELAKRSENLKPFAKLLLLYRASPDFLREIFAQTLWHSKPTSFEYEAAEPLPESVVSDLSAASGELEASFARAIGGRRVQFQNVRMTFDGVSVFSFLREFTPIVRKDFRAAYNVHHGCGLILFGVDSERRRVFVKVGNKALAHVLAQWIRDKFSADLRLLQNDIFSDYTTDDLRTKILGGYSNQHSIEITSATFAHSAFGHHGPLTLSQAFLQPSIKTELEFLAQGDLVEIHGPADISTLSLTYRGKPVRIVSTVVAGGAVRFSYDNTGWDLAAQDAFGTAFFETFGVPVNKLLHPARAALGSLGIYSYLLGIANEDEVQPYHEESMQRLLELQLVTKESVATRVCRNNLCPVRNQPVAEATRLQCAKCDRELEEWQLNRLDRNNDRIGLYVANIFDDADDWKLKGQGSKLDTQTYYELHRRRPDGREDTICMLIADRPTSRSRRVFERSGLPLLFVQRSTDARHIYVNDDGIAYASLSYLLAAQENEATRADCKDLCTSTLTRLIQNHEERTLKAARLSHARLTEANLSMSGDDYEVDVFNLLRSLFPYSYKLAKKGNIEPDGYVCVPHYESNSLDAAGSWNWSYDAKFSAKTTGYDFDVDEARKVINYIKKLRRNRRALFGERRRTRAHVIISNNLREELIRNAAELIFGPDGVGKDHRDVRLVLMRGGFLNHLYERVRSEYEAITRRRPFFGDEFIALLQSTPESGYKVLGQADADTLVNTVLACPEIEENITPKDLADSLAE